MDSGCKEHGLPVWSEDVRRILCLLDPEGVSLRTGSYAEGLFASGTNFIWRLDCYDKLQPFGICISRCICGFSMKLIWLNAYSTNNNSRIIGGYFLEAVKEYGGWPRLVRVSFGTKNGHVISQLMLCRAHENNIYIFFTWNIFSSLSCARHRQNNNFLFLYRANVIAGVKYMFLSRAHEIETYISCHLYATVGTLTSVRYFAEVVEPV